MAPHVCPWWLGYLLSCPLRKLFDNPEQTLQPYVAEGMTVLDAGCAMGFYTLEMAKLVGTNGKVIAVDVQEKMIKSLIKRAAKAGMNSRIEARICDFDSLRIDDLNGSVDFAGMFNVVHEVENQEKLLKEIYSALKPGGIAFIIEPSGHVNRTEFNNSVCLAVEKAGFVKQDSSPDLKRSFTAILRKDSDTNS